jgi:hypothetical protein
MTGTRPTAHAEDFRRIDEDPRQVSFLDEAEQQRLL